MKEVIIRALQDIKFAERYQEICNDFPDMDRGLNFKKKNIEIVLKQNDIDLDYVSAEKFFCKEYCIKDLKIRFCFGYKYGFIECFYVISENNNMESLYGRFNTIATLQNNNFNNMVKHKFPIATSLEDLKEILNRVIKLHNDFMQDLAKKYEVIIKYLDE